MNPAKAALLLVWLLCAASFVIAPDLLGSTALGSTGSTLATWARYTFWLMCVAHLVEFALFLPKLRRAHGSMPTHFLNTMVFGVLHIRGLSPVEADGGD